MDQWIKALLQTVNVILGGPTSFLQLYVAAGLGVLVLLIVLNKVTGAFDAGNPGVGPVLMAAIPSVLVTMLLVAAVRIYVLPKVDEAVGGYLVIGAAVLGLLLLAAPLLLKTVKVGYITSAITWGIAIAAFATVIYITGAVFSLAGSMKGDADKAEERKETLQGYIDLR